MGREGLLYWFLRRLRKILYSNDDYLDVDF